MAINEFAIEGLKPDITLYLDVDVEVGLKRIKDKKSKRTQDRLELEAVTFHEEVSKAYHLLIEKDPSRFRIIDASLDQDSVFQNALDALITVIEEYDSHNSN